MHMYRLALALSLNTIAYHAMTMAPPQHLHNRVAFPEAEPWFMLDRVPALHTAHPDRVGGVQAVG